MAEPARSTIEDVARLAMSLDGVTEGTRWSNRTWFVQGRGFVWERPLTKADIKRMTAAGEVVPDGEVIAVLLDDLGEKQAELAERRAGVFDIEHFAKYPAVLLQLSVADRDTVDELVRTAWMTASSRKR